MAHSNSNDNIQSPWWTPEKIINWGQQQENGESVAKFSMDSGASTSTPSKPMSGDTSPSPLCKASKELLLERKEERLKKLEKKLEEEKEMLSIGRDQLNTDRQRHQVLMKEAIRDMNQQVALERKRFIEEMTKEMERFKLPSIKRMIQPETERVTALISAANEVYQEGCDAVVWNEESDQQKIEG